jgi:hypothetical protein
VSFIDCAPVGRDMPTPSELQNAVGVRRQTHEYPTRQSNVIALALLRMRHRVLRWVSRFLPAEWLPSDVLSVRMWQFESVLMASGATAFVAHNVDTLLPAWRAAKATGGTLVFDSMEFHSEMGEGQTAGDRALTRKIERLCLPECALVTASSDLLADALSATYEIERPTPLYNTPPVTNVRVGPREGPLRLYWRNSTLGFGQRGLQDALTALTLLPPDVELHLRGKLGADDGRGLRSRIEHLRLEGRVFIHPPHLPAEAVACAAENDIGLCLEHSEVMNHHLTVSNKLFDYLMAGLAVVVSDLPPLRAVVERSGGGIVYEPGSPESLANAVGQLRADPDRLLTLRMKARQFALSDGNRERDMRHFLKAWDAKVRPMAGAA